jgi:hypothetical protein
VPSLRQQVKDAVTASNKSWLLEIRNISGQVGKVALESMESRTRRWRARQDKDPILKSSRVGSAVEAASNEGKEGMLLSCLLSYSRLIISPSRSFAQRQDHGRLPTIIPVHSNLHRP